MEVANSEQLPAQLVKIEIEEPDSGDLDHISVFSDTEQFVSFKQEVDEADNPQQQNNLHQTPVILHVQAPSKFTNEQEFFSESEQSIGSVVRECICVLQRDAREYHPFYLRVYKYATIGIKFGYLNGGDESLAGFWQKWDNFAKEQWSNPSFVQFSEPHSPYLQYLLNKKVILNGEQVKLKKRSKAEQTELVAELEQVLTQMRIKCKTMSKEQILGSLDLRLEFFENVKHVTSPVDTELMNGLWSRLMAGNDEQITKRKRKTVQFLDDEIEIKVPPKKRKGKQIENTCPHCQKKLTVPLENHVSRMHLITLDGKVINRPNPKDLQGLTNTEKAEVWKEWQRQRRLNKTEEERRQERKRLKERYLKKLESMTEEQRQEAKRKRDFYRLHKRLEEKSLSEEERQRRKMASWLRHQALLAEKGRDWGQLKVERAKAWSRQKRAQLTDEMRAELRRKHKEYRDKLQGEKLQRYKDSVRKSVRKYFERLKRENYAEWWNRTTGQQRLRWDDLLNYQRERTRKETMEQRQARLLRYRINQAKRKRRQELEKEGVMDEQGIENELAKLEEKMRNEPREKLSEYKPRLGARKPHKVKNARVPPWEISTEPPGMEHQVEVQESLEVSDLITFAPDPNNEAGVQTFSVEFHEQNPSLTLVQSLEGGGTETQVQLSFPSGTYLPGEGDQPNFIFLTDEQAQALKPLAEDGSLQSSQIILVSGPLPGATTEESVVASEQIIEAQEASGQLMEVDGTEYEPIPEPEPELVPDTETEVETTVKPKVSEANLPPSKQPAICEECGKTFTTQASVHLHKNLVHPADPSILICPKCGISRSSTLSLWNHFISVHLSSEIDPLLPSSLFPKRSTLPRTQPYKQLRSHPGGNLFCCPTCSKGFIQKCTLDDHIRRVHQGQGHFCPVCGKDQQSASKLWRHQVEKHNMRDLAPPPELPSLRCKYCQEYVMRGYPQHVRKKHPEELNEFLEWYKTNKGTAPKSKSNLQKVRCPHCPSEVKARLLNRHIKNMHTSRPKHPCPECGFQFKRLDHMKKHFRDHHAVADIEKKLEAKQLISIKSLNRNFSVSCLLCQQEIKSKVLLRAHFVQNHHQIFEQCQVATLPIFQCTFCDEKFAKETSLKEHLELCHRDKLKTCQHCGIWKLNEEELKAHEKSHRKLEIDKMLKQGKCSLCDFGATGANLENELQNHVKLEHGESYLACPNAGCGKWVMSQLDMTNHLARCQRNNGSLSTKQFVEKTLGKLMVRCDECKKPQRLYLLDKHIKTKHLGYGGTKEWSCELCKPRVFKDRRYYVAHMHLLHQMKLEELLDLVHAEDPVVQKQKEDGRMEVERDKRLVVQVERLSDDLINYYLAREIVVKLEPN